MRLGRLFRRRSRQQGIPRHSLLDDEGLGSEIAADSEFGDLQTKDTIASLSSSPSQLILREILSPKEFESRLREGIKIPSSIIKGRFYVLQIGKRIKVLDKRRGRNKITYLCVGSNQCAEDVDEYTALYLNLVLNEKGLLRAANVMNTDFQGLMMQSWTRRTSSF
jgi:hypothetical protein